jgi:SAM-dependent methyltransferase
MPSASSKRYDKAYFDKWYRNPRSRVVTPASTERKVRMVVGIAEYLLERPIRRVLDVGCGEAPWRAQLRRIRPRVHYEGIDPSPYVVERFGTRRNIRLGGFGDVGRVGLEGAYDLVVCSDVLQYVEDADLVRGLAAISRMLEGVAFLEAYTTGDELVGDRRQWQDRSAREWRRRLKAAHLTACGMHCYVAAPLEDRLLELERADG